MAWRCLAERDSGCKLGLVGSVQDLERNRSSPALHRRTTSRDGIGFRCSSQLTQQFGSSWVQGRRNIGPWQHRASAGPWQDSSQCRWARTVRCIEMSEQGLGGSRSNRSGEPKEQGVMRLIRRSSNQGVATTQASSTSGNAGKPRR